jgi:hypothetical protein
MFGLLVGAFAHSLISEMSRSAFLGGGAALGFGVGWTWWLAVGRRWLADND